MHSREEDRRILVGCAGAGAGLVLVMFGIFLATGIGQDALQIVRPTEAYTELLLGNPPMLRTVLGLDNLFLVLYTTVFIALGSEFGRSVYARAGVALMMLVGLLDLVENLHLLTMLAMAEAGLPLGVERISLQVVESQLKFHLSYAGLFLLGFALPKSSLEWRMLRFSFLWVQLPVGVLIYFVPVLGVVRLSFFFAGLAMVAWIYAKQPDGLSAPE